MAQKPEFKPKLRRKRDEGYFDDTPFESDTTKEKIPTPESILDEAKALDFSQQDSTDVKKFSISYGDWFQKDTPENFLHVLAERSAPGAETAKDWPKKRLCSFMKWFLKHYSHFLMKRIESGVDSKDYPLHTAFSKRNYVFIEEVLSHPSLINLQEVLEQKTTRNQTYIHLAIISKSPLVKVVADKCKELCNNQIWKGSGEKKLTPLHVAVEGVHRFCNILESNNPKQRDGEIILSYVKKTLKGDSEPTPAADSYIKNIVSIFDEWKKAFLKPDKENRVQPIAVADLLLKLIRDHQDSKDRMSQVEVVRLLISLCREVLSDKGVVDFETPGEPPKELTPYQMRLLELKDAWDNLVDFLREEKIKVSDKDRDGALRQVIIEDPVADAIRSYCLHNFKRDLIAKCLYQPGDGKNL